MHAVGARAPISNGSARARTRSGEVQRLRNKRARARTRVPARRRRRWAKAVAVSPNGDSYALRHEQSERPVVLHRHGLTGLPRGVWRRPNRDGDAGGSEPFRAVARLLSGGAGRPPSFSKFTLPVHDRPSICFKRPGA